MYICIHIYIYIYIDMYACMYIYKYIYKYAFIYMNSYMYIPAHVNNNGKEREGCLLIHSSVRQIVQF